MAPASLLAHFMLLLTSGAGFQVVPMHAVQRYTSRQLNSDKKVERNLVLALVALVVQ